MPFKFGNKNGSKIYKGTTEISKVYKGSTEIYSSFTPLIATGGTTTTYTDNGITYKSHTFTSSGTFTVSSLGSDNQLDYLIVAGGGGGSLDQSGGGGAGGYRTTLGTNGGNSAAESKITATVQSYTITVGAGGTKQTVSGTRAENGSNSLAFNITSLGGGGAAARLVIRGANGGSGGGGGWGNSEAAIAGQGATGQGFDGGYGQTGCCEGGGGGGAGQQGFSFSQGSNGGNGLQSIIKNGTLEYRAGGGAGGVGNNGGLGGGGNSTQDGQNNTGGGGGAGLSNNLGGNGGSGIVIIRYRTA